jgi:hypothetical protein
MVEERELMIHSRTEARKWIEKNKGAFCSYLVSSIENICLNVRESGN